VDASSDGQFSMQTNFQNTHKAMSPQKDSCSSERSSGALISAHGKFNQQQMSILERLTMENLRLQKECAFWKGEYERLTTKQAATSFSQSRAVRSITSTPHSMKRSISLNNYLLNGKKDLSVSNNDGHTSNDSILHHNTHTTAASLIKPKRFLHNDWRDIIGAVNQRIQTLLASQHDPTYSVLAVNSLPFSLLFRLELELQRACRSQVPPLCKFSVPYLNQSVDGSLGRSCVRTSTIA
jgi:hypothetical protein